jgi:hypothetical protein
MNNFEISYTESVRKSDKNNQNMVSITMKAEFDKTEKPDEVFEYLRGTVRQYLNKR